MLSQLIFKAIIMGAVASAAFDISCETIAGKFKGSYLCPRSKALGEGSTGLTYLLTDGESGAMFTGKAAWYRKDGQADGDILQGVLNEVTILNESSHPNIIQLFEVERGSATLYFLMEFGDQGDLYHYLRRNRGFARDTTAIMDMFGQIVSAVRYIHRVHKMVHADLKLGNIVVVRKNGRDVPKVIDFDIAEKIGENGYFAGTYGYMAPEVMMEHDFQWNEKVDVFSLGVILYNLLHHRVPFPGNDVDSVWANMQTGKIQVKAGFSYDILLILNGCLQLDPAARFTMKDLIKIIRRFQIQPDAVVSRASEVSCVERIPESRTQFEKNLPPTFMEAIGQALENVGKMIGGNARQGAEKHLLAQGLVPPHRGASSRVLSDKLKAAGAREPVSRDPVHLKI